MLAYEGQIRNVFLIAYVIVALLAALNWQKMILGIAAIWPIALVVALAWLSNFWSVAPEITSRRCIALTVTTPMGVYLFVRFDLTTLLRFLVSVSALLAVGCIAWVVFIPDCGLHSDATHSGAWRGIFFQKNTTGQVMVYGLAIVIAAWASGTIHRGLGLLLIGGLVAVRMVRGNAMKSALVTLVVLAVAWHGALIGAASYDLILEALGRDASLIGCTEIWTYTLEYALKQPFTGYGYDAFWNGELSPGALHSHPT